MYHFVVDLAEPYVVLHLVVACGLGWLWLRRPRAPRRLALVTAAFALLFLGSTRAVAYLALGSLEWAYPPADGEIGDADTVVILAGRMLRRDRVRRQAKLGDSTLRRCLHGARLYRRGGIKLVVVSGGKVCKSEPGPPSAHVMKAFLIEQGVPADRLLAEDRSTTTYENAVQTAKLLRQRGVRKIVLVTDATHLRRAERCFLAQGLEVAPAGCYYGATRFAGGLTDFLPDPDAAEDVEDVWHEWLGMLWYWVHGRI